MIKKVLVSAAILFGAAVSFPASAGADPSSFGVLSCSCEGGAALVSEGNPVTAEQIKAGIRSGLADVPVARH